MELPMTIKHLRIFVTVYQEGNVTRAASLLHMTQPAVTRSIQELENHYGIRLFERINHKLYRTKRGEDLYARALHILDSFDDLEKEFQNPEIIFAGKKDLEKNYAIPSAFSAYL